MFETFSQTFQLDVDAALDHGTSDEIRNMPELVDLLGRFGGGSFRNGLYRIVRAGDLAVWKRRVSIGFPQFESRIVCFGYDWLGTVFALDTDRLVDGRPGVVMFEPGTGKALVIPCNLRSFHDSGLIEFGEAALAINFHQAWLAAGGSVPSYHQCAGYKTPLFLGGKDIVECLEISDIDVYWHIMGQLIRKVRGLAPGASVRVSAS